MELTTFSNITAIFDVGMYDSPLGDMWDADKEELAACGATWEDFMDAFDYGKFKETVVETANGFIDAARVENGKTFAEFCGLKSIKATGCCSPREYNFMTDWLDLTLEADENFPKTAAANLRKWDSKLARKFVEDNWKSGPGFISWMTEDYDELVEHFEAWANGEELENDRDIGAYVAIAGVACGFNYRDEDGWSVYCDNWCFAEAIGANHSFLDFIRNDSPSYGRILAAYEKARAA